MVRHDIGNFGTVLLVYRKLPVDIYLVNRMKNYTMTRDTSKMGKIHPVIRQMPFLSLSLEK